ncbi:MAG: phosphatidylglycerophosphatase A [Ignavibacteriota bacterium]|nr:phosphatidylglycerophosphatase A [Ignavibacteriota bacterium]
MRLIKTKKIVDENVKIDFFTMFLASAFFTGYFPVASGTVGSLFAVLFVLIPGFYSPVVLLTLSLIFFFVGIVVSNRMMQRYGEDPSVVVIDEVVGVWISLFIITMFGYDNLFLVSVLSFLTFRVFDILKVYPGNYFDRMNSGVGIMMDDVVAGVYSGFASVLLIKVYLGLW